LKYEDKDGFFDLYINYICELCVEEIYLLKTIIGWNKENI